MVLGREPRDENVDIVALRLYYEWPIYVSLLSDNLSNIGNNRLLIATQVFRNEPYK